MQEIDTQPAGSKSIYVFFAVSITFGIFSFLAGLLLIIDALKNFNTASIDVMYWTPILIGLVGLTFGLLAKEKTKSDKASPEQGCAVDLTIYFNIIIPFLYVLALFGLMLFGYWLID
jgi:hypothetical protein